MEIDKNELEYYYSLSDSQKASKLYFTFPSEDNIKITLKSPHIYLVFRDHHILSYIHFEGDVFFPTILCKPLTITQLYIILNDHNHLVSEYSNNKINLSKYFTDFCYILEDRIFLNNDIYYEYQQQWYKMVFSLWFEILIQNIYSHDLYMKKIITTLNINLLINVINPSMKAYNEIGNNLIYFVSYLNNYENKVQLIKFKSNEYLFSMIFNFVRYFEQFISPKSFSPGWNVIIFDVIANN